jgi:hypothetical protein
MRMYSAKRQASAPVVIGLAATLQLGKIVSVTAAAKPANCSGWTAVGLRPLRS